MKTSTHQAVIEQFNRFSWNHWGVLTSIAPESTKILDKRFQRWIRELARENQDRVHHLYVIEKSRSQRPHIHFQLGSMNIPTTRMLELWKELGGGIQNLIEPYDPAKGSEYVLKDWSISEFSGFNIKGMNEQPLEVTV